MYLSEFCHPVESSKHNRKKCPSNPTRGSQATTNKPVSDDAKNPADHTSYTLHQSFDKQQSSSTSANQHQAGINDGANDFKSSPEKGNGEGASVHHLMKRSFLHTRRVILCYTPGRPSVYPSVSNFLCTQLLLQFP